MEADSDGEARHGFLHRAAAFVMAVWGKQRLQIKISTEHVTGSQPIFTWSAQPISRWTKDGCSFFSLWESLLPIAHMLCASLSLHLRVCCPAAVSFYWPVHFPPWSLDTILPAWQFYLHRFNVARFQVTKEWEAMLSRHWGLASGFKLPTINPLCYWTYLWTADILNSLTMSSHREGKISAFLCTINFNKGHPIKKMLV